MINNGTYFSSRYLTVERSKKSPQFLKWRPDLGFLFSDKFHLFFYIENLFSPLTNFDSRGFIHDWNINLGEKKLLSTSCTNKWGEEEQDVSFLSCLFPVSRNIMLSTKAITGPRANSLRYFPSETLKCGEESLDFFPQ